MPALLAPAHALAATEVGKAVAIATSVKGDNAGSVRQLEDGDEVFEHERIETDAKGTGQFEFLDRTRLAIGPASVVTLDRFVFDANRKAKDVAIEVGRGALRFLSGSSPSRAYRITTPSATLGVRGTAFDLYVTETGTLCVAMINGSVEVCPRGRACRRHNVVGRFLVLSPDGLFSLRNTWDGAILGGVPFATAMPFLAGQAALVPAFRVTQNVATRYLQTVPGALGKAATKIVPNVPKILPTLPNPFR